MSEVSIYLDGPSLEQISEIDPNIIKGFTFNPTLFRNAGVQDYLGHCQKILEVCGELPVSLEVIADDHEGMVRQARILAGLGSNVFVKIPITFTNGETTKDVIGTGHNPPVIPIASDNDNSWTVMPLLIIFFILSKTAFIVVGSFGFLY